MSDPRIIVALDLDGATEVDALVAALDPAHCRLKVGNELFTRAGPGLVRGLGDRGFEVFLDLKFHDIPNTVARACTAAAELGVWMLNVHAAGGRRMLEAARAALEPAPARPRLVGVTMLTSLSDTDLDEIGLRPGGAAAHVLQLARLCRDAGLDGVVCSAREAAVLRGELGRGFLLVTPGIRPAGAAGDDQSRTMTPADAVAAGSDYLVVGRPVTRAPDPAAALATLVSELGGVERSREPA